MTVELTVKNDKGETVVQISGPVHTPLQWKAPPGFPLISERGDINGAYKVWALTVTPVAVLDLQYGKPPNPNTYKVF